MIITVTTNEKKALSVLINKYADLAFQVMEFAGTSPEGITRENCFEQLEKEVTRSGNIKVINESTVQFDEEVLIKATKQTTIVLDFLQKLAPLVVPVIKEATPIINQFVEDMDKA